MRNIQEDDVWKFIYNSIITRFSIPYIIVMDNGPQLKENFQETTLSKLSLLRNMRKVMHRLKLRIKQFSTTLRKKIDKHKRLWAEKINRVLWAYRSIPRRVASESPFSLCDSSGAILPTELWAQQPDLLLSKTPHEESLISAIDLLEELCTKVAFC